MKERIAIIGGTGKEGKGLAYRWAKAGYEIVIGSRHVEKAQLAADEINLMLNNEKNMLSGLENHQAADWCEIAVLTVPYSVHVEMLASIKASINGKLLIDVTVPLVPPKVKTVQMPQEGSAGMQAKKVLGDGIDVVTAFQNISYERLLSNENVGCDVLVCGSSKEARARAIILAQDAGMIAWDAGPLENSMVSEGLTSILIGINSQFGIHNAGIKITGIEPA